MDLFTRRQGDFLLVGYHTSFCNGPGDQEILLLSWWITPTEDQEIFSWWGTTLFLSHQETKKFFWSPCGSIQQETKRISWGAHIFLINQETKKFSCPPGGSIHQETRRFSPGGVPYSFFNPPGDQEILLFSWWINSPGDKEIISWWVAYFF